jgi:hypothetical protein
VCPIKHEKGIPLLLKAILTPIAVEVIADFDVEKLVLVVSVVRNPLSAILGGAALTQKKVFLSLSLSNPTKDADIMI